MTIHMSALASDETELSFVPAWAKDPYYNRERAATAVTRGAGRSDLRGVLWPHGTAVRHHDRSALLLSERRPISVRSANSSTVCGATRASCCSRATRARARRRCAGRCSHRSVTARSRRSSSTPTCRAPKSCASSCATSASSRTRTCGAGRWPRPTCRSCSTRSRASSSRSSRSPATPSSSSTRRSRCAAPILDQIRLLTALEHDRRRLVQVVLCGQPGLAHDNQERGAARPERAHHAARGAHAARARGRARLHPAPAGRGRRGRRGALRRGGHERGRRTVARAAAAHQRHLRPRAAGRPHRGRERHHGRTGEARGHGRSPACTTPRPWRPSGRQHR